MTIIYLILLWLASYALSFGFLNAYFYRKYDWRYGGVNKNIKDHLVLFLSGPGGLLATILLQLLHKEYFKYGFKLDYKTEPWADELMKFENCWGMDYSDIKIKSNNMNILKLALGAFFISLPTIVMVLFILPFGEVIKGFVIALGSLFCIIIGTIFIEKSTGQ